MAALSNRGGVSRRRVIQGAAWSAPVIVLATSVPAQAASVPVPGRLALPADQVSANLTLPVLTVNATVLYLDDGTAAPDLPVTSIVATVVVPTAKINPVPDPNVGNLYWSFTTKATEGANTVYTFTWHGPDLELSNPATAQLIVSIPRASQSAPVESEWFVVTVRADGESNGEPVPQVSASTTTVVGAQVIFNVVPPIQAQTNFNGQGPAYVFYGQTRWYGPYWPTGQPVQNLLVTARVPAQYLIADLGAVLYEPEIAGWTRESGPELVEGWVRVQYRFTGTIDVNNHNTPNLQFGLKSANASPTLNVAVARTEGVTTGTGDTVFDQRQGPAAVVTGVDPLVLVPEPPDVGATGP